METTVHRQLKEHFCTPNSLQEVKFGRFRIDVVDGDRLIEIQHSGLSAIRSKIENLVSVHQVDVVKPIIIRKKLISLNRRNGRVVSQRLSPRRGGFLDLFDELLYFTSVFPHPNLRIITPMIEVEEIRFPGHGRRRWKRSGDFVVQDRIMTNIVDSKSYQAAQDLHQHLPQLDSSFDTRQIAEGLNIKRCQAQRIAYVMRLTGSIQQVGKRGNLVLYRLVDVSRLPATIGQRRSQRKKPTIAAA